MKLSRNDIFIAISAALLLVVFIQINWLLETANIKEEMFNEKANIVLARTTEALSLDTSICKKIETEVGKKELQKIDSLHEFLQLSSYLYFYRCS